VRFLVAAGLGGAVAAVAYWRRLLTLGGCVAAALVGTITFGRRGWPAAATLLAFFFSASGLSRLPKGNAEPQAKGARRDAWQVLANGGAACLCIAFRNSGGFVGALAAASADTWATELGMRSGQRPRLITTWREVDTGRSGGITAVGLLASAGGAIAVGLAWVLSTGERRMLSVALLAGVLGSLLDSLLGATVQGLFRCRACGRLLEEGVHCGAAAELMSGYPYVSNDAVNALVTASAAVLGTLAYRSRRENT
jgi:uncharacterized protein (TIGR00297 family)